MKKIIIIVLAMFGIVQYLLNRKKTPVVTAAPKPSHHLTKVFSKAKQQAVHS